VTEHREETVFRPIGLHQRNFLSLDQRLALVRGLRRFAQRARKDADLVDASVVRDFGSLALRIASVWRRGR
jgi:hypothetical protein